MHIMFYMLLLTSSHLIALSITRQSITSKPHNSLYALSCYVSTLLKSIFKGRFESAPTHLSYLIVEQAVFF
jgi:hypothetical protein